MRPACGYTAPLPRVCGPVRYQPYCYLCPSRALSVRAHFPHLAPLVKRDENKPCAPHPNRPGGRRPGVVRTRRRLGSVTPPRHRRPGVAGEATRQKNSTNASFTDAPTRPSPTGACGFDRYMYGLLPSVYSMQVRGGGVEQHCRAAVLCCDSMISANRRRTLIVSVASQYTL